jgi:hypothetical protein
MADRTEHSARSRNSVHSILKPESHSLSQDSQDQVLRSRKYVATFRQTPSASPDTNPTSPKVPTHPIKFERTLFASGSTPEADEAWGNDLTPPGDGFVLIPSPQDYSLPPGQTTDEGEGEIYDISVFHQLHCLNHVRTFLFTLKAGMDYGTINETYDNMLKPQEDHVYHCFDYIRQALMCNADLTVEWPRTEESGERVAVDGWGVTHQCKNWVSCCPCFFFLLGISGLKCCLWC